MIIIYFPACVFSIVILFILFIILRTVLGNAAPVKDPQSAAEITVNDADRKAAEKLSRLIRLKTVSYTDYERMDRDEFAKVETFFDTAFPYVSAKLERKKINDLAYVFHWQGTSPELKAGLLLAHFDVVPADKEEWSVDPFGGIIEGGYIWGRGALDTKNTLLGILEAAERLLASGFSPERSWYFAFGGDEEVMGLKGAMTITKYFKNEGIDFEFVIDEGSAALVGLLPGIERPLGLIGVAEKGFANVILEVEGESGHSSIPPRETSTAILAAAIHRLNRKRTRSRLPKASEEFFRSLAPHASFYYALVFYNMRILFPFIKGMLSRISDINALIRTTEAVTMLSGSDKENVLAKTARAVVNVRILPGETVEHVLKNIQKRLADDRVKVSLLNTEEANDPVPKSETEGKIYQRIRTNIRRVVPDAVVVPFLGTGTTDSKHYRSRSENIYRFAPMLLDEEELDRIHGKDERISFENLARIIQFYTLTFEEKENEYSNGYSSLR